MSKIIEFILFILMILHRKCAHDLTGIVRNSSMSKPSQLNKNILDQINDDLFYQTIHCGACKSENRIATGTKTKFVLCNNSGCRRVLKVLKK